MMLAGGIARNKTIEGVLINIFQGIKMILTGDGAITEEMAKKKLYKKLRIQRGRNLRVLLLN